MEVIIRPDPAAAARLAAQVIGKALRAKPHLVLGLATGHTMEAVYADLVRLHQEAGLDFSLCRTFNLDEYIGIPPADERSYRYYMDQHLFHRVNIDPRNTHLPDGMARDLQAACREYEASMAECGGIGLQLLGIGSDGHIAFNEPSSSLGSRTRIKTLAKQTIEDNARFFERIEDVPIYAITMGVGTILDAREIVLLATGTKKAAIVAKAVEGPVTSMVTASALQLHPACKVIVDEAAAGELKAKDYYRWIFENEPDWAPYRDAP